MSDQQDRADYRFISDVLDIMPFGKQIERRRSDYDRICRVFVSLGGNWERVFSGGSVTDVALLKRILKAAFKHGFLTRKEPWSDRRPKT